MADRAEPAVNISHASFALLVKDIDASVQFYSEKLGFQHEVIGEKVPICHVSRGGLVLILFQAKNEDEVQPISSRYEEQYFDVYGYTNAVDLLAKEFEEKGLAFIREPNYTSHWSEFTIRDLNGYQITFGGGLIDKSLISGTWS